MFLTQKLSLPAESAEKQTTQRAELPQTSSQSRQVLLPPQLTNKESEKPELPVNKQEHYELHYNCQPAAPSYDGWEKQALPVGNGEMGAKVSDSSAKKEFSTTKNSLVWWPTAR